MLAYLPWLLSALIYWHYWHVLQKWKAACARISVDREASVDEINWKFDDLYRYKKLYEQIRHQN